ncbi:hypothetical protein [Streptomyces sp. HD]|nr:hypothetical protein [Streptomyces sp. HD]MDC0772628.1 hypothetical protein [Streptomyces sp. HD]
MAATTSLTLVKIRIGFAEWRRRRRKYLGSDGSNAVSCNPSPQAAFQRRS